jgi:cytochrome c-type biogenesis protein CcmE
MNHSKARTRISAILWGLTFVGLAVALWLQIARDIRYFGPVPSLVLFIVPMLAGHWVYMWPECKANRARLWYLVLLTLFMIAALMMLVEW